MIEQNARAAEHVVSLAVFLDNPEAIEFGHSIRAIGMKGGILVLGHLLHFAIKFGCGCLIDAAALFKTTHSHSLEHAEHADSVDVGSKFGRIERHLHMALGGQIVDFVGPDLAHHLHHTHGVA